MPIIIAWKQRKLEYNYEKEELEQITLKDLLNACSKEINVPEERIKILFSGVRMKNEDLSLAQYGIHPNSKLLMIATPVEEEVSETSNFDKEEAKLKSQVEAKLEASKKQLEPLLEEFRQSLDAHLKQQSQLQSNSFSVESTADLQKRLKQLEFKHRQICEIGTQNLIQLDGIIGTPPMFSLREARKNAVRALQKILEDADSAWDVFVQRGKL